jgi:raffinose/stachyose/melibiose transport system permease protein
MRVGVPERIVRHGVLLIGVLIVLVPFLGILSVALQPASANVSGLSFPTSLTLDNFTRAWDLANFSSLMTSSAVIAVSVVPAGVILSTMAGFAMATMRFVGRPLVLALLLVGLVMPFEAIVISLYHQLDSWGLNNTWLAVILPQIGGFVAFGTFWMRTFFGGIPRELVESARVDGANSLQVLRHVMLPVAKPAISTLAVLMFMWSWNEFVLALVLLQDAEKLTAPAGLGAFVGQFTRDIPGMCAAALLVATPVVIVYIIAQRQFIRGILQGAVKG